MPSFLNFDKNTLQNYCWIQSWALRDTELMKGWEQSQMLMLLSVAEGGPCHSRLPPTRFFLLQRNHQDLSLQTETVKRSFSWGVLSRRIWDVHRP